MINEPDDKQDRLTKSVIKTFDLVNESKQGESEFSQRLNEPRYLKPLAKP